MERLILDTSILIDAERSGADLLAFFRREDDVAIAAVTVAELLSGVALADERRGPRRAAFVNEVVGAATVVDYDIHVASTHATLIAATRKDGKPRGAHDLIVAATALASQRTIVTLDTKGFGGLPGVLVRTTMP